MNKKAIVPLVLGLGIGLLAVKFGIDAIRKAKASGVSQTTVSVIKAKQDINAFDEIQPNMIEAVEVVESPMVPANDRIGDVDKVVGRVAGKSIPRGSPVLSSMLAPEGTVAGILGRIKPGYRAVSVKIDEVNSASYQLRPGVFVDVTVVMDIANNNRNIRGGKETVSEVILQRVEVASVGYGMQGEAEGQTGKIKPAKSATLFVRKQDVPKLHLAQTRGKIALALRGEQDTDSSAVVRATGDDLLGVSKEKKQEPSSLAQMMALFASSRKENSNTQTPSPEPEVKKNKLSPHGVLVFHHSTVRGESDVVEQMVFENSKSSRLLSVQLGVPDRAGAAMRQDRGANTGN